MNSQLLSSRILRRGGGGEEISKHTQQREGLLYSRAGLSYHLEEFHVCHCNKRKRSEENLTFHQFSMIFFNEKIPQSPNFKPSLTSKKKKKKKLYNLTNY